MNGTLVKNELIFDFASGALGASKSIFASTYLFLNTKASNLNSTFEGLLGDSLLENKDTPVSKLKYTDCISDKMKTQKQDLNKFLVSLQSNNKLPRVKSIEIKPKYIVQTEEKLLSFKVFINSKKKAPKVFTRFFENQFRKEFSLMGVPMKIIFISSLNPYSG